MLDAGFLDINPRLLSISTAFIWYRSLKKTDKTVDVYHWLNGLDRVIFFLMLFFLMKIGLVWHLNKTDKILSTGVKLTCTFISCRTSSVKKGHVLGWTGEG